MMSATSKAVKDMAVILDDMAETWKCGGVSMHADDCVLAAKMLRSIALENERVSALHAAAPDLLAALKAMVVEYCDYTIINNLGNPETQHNIKLARAAIAKAEGAHVAALEAKERT